ncbi:MAG: glycosyltransferase family 2 protein, partial [Nitrospirae bacterium]|nr:glycosyltransferase family 2 protein [Nitrospirota bacterium]
DQINLSIVLCTYNEAKNVENTLISLRNQQTSAKFEIIGVDNGSSDSTSAILMAYVDYLLYCDKRGKIPCMRVGVRHAKGDIVALADADTIYPVDWIEQAFSCFNKIGKPVLVFGQSYMGMKPTFLSYILSSLFVRLSFLCGVGCSVGFNMAARRVELSKVLEQIGEVGLSGWGIGTALLRQYGRSKAMYEPKMTAPKCMRRIHNRGWIFAFSLWVGEWVRLATGNNLSVTESEYYGF